jgi:hypothetical protein
MALLNFPDPGVIQTYTANGNTWEWNGTSWISANNLNLSDQVTGVLGTVYGGTGKALSGMSVGSVIYADTSSSFAALAPGTNNYVLATQGSGSAPYWKIDDSGTGSVGNGNTGGFAYYTGLNSITSGTAVSYIAASNRIVLTSQILSLPSSVIDSGIWAGTAISLANGGTNGNRAGIAISYELAVYNAAGTAITQIDTTSAIGNSVLLQVSQTVMPTWVGQSSLVAGGAITSQKWHEARTVTFATGDVTGSFSIDGSANVSNVALTIGADSVALGTDTTGNYVGFVNTAGTGLSIIGSAGEGIGFTVVSNATNNNTASTIVARDGSGDFSAGTITANLTGTASIATSSRLVNTLATTDTRYLAGVVLNTGVGSTQIYTGSGITIGSNIITATTFAGNATSATNSGFAGIATSAILAGIGSTVGTAFLTGVLTNSASGGTQIFTGSGITIGNNVITSTSFQGTATSSITSGLAATALNAGIAWTSNFSGSAFTSTNAGLSQRVNLSQFTGAGTSFLVFSDVINGTAALGATGFIKITASTGSIGASSYTGTWTGTAVTALYGGTGLASVNKLDVLTGASSGNSWIAIGSTFLPSAYIGENAPAALAAFGATQPGQLWWDSTYGVLKVYYADTNTNQWVDALPVLGSNGGSAVKRSFILSFGAGFTPSTGSDSVSIAIPYAPDNTSLFYFIKRLDFRNETTSSGAGVSFYIERNTTQSPTTAWTTANTITSAAGSSFKAGAGIYITSYTNSGSGASFVSSAGVAASVMSGDYLRLNFSALNSAATMSVSIIIEQQ